MHMYSDTHTPFLQLRSQLFEPNSTCVNIEMETVIPHLP